MRKLQGFFLLLLIFVIAQTLWATDYHIDTTNGNDSNNGLSTSTAWRTIAKVNSSMGLFSPGDRILFRRGQTFGGNRSLHIACNGSINNPITFGAYGTGSKPVFDADSFNLSSAIWSNGNSYITIDNIRIQDCTGTAATGIVVRNTSGGFIYDIAITNCEVNNVSSGGGILFIRIDGYLIDGCTITNCREYGIAIYGSPSNFIRNGTIQNCEVAYCPKDGITLHRADSYAEPIGANHFIYNNVVHDIYLEDGIDVTAGENIILRDNEIYNVTNLCDISVNHIVDHVFIENHYGHNSKNALNVGESGGGDSNHTVVTNSRFYDYTHNTFGSYSDMGSDLYIANNTVVTTDSLVAPAPLRINYFGLGNRPDGLTWKNNIWTSTSYSRPSTHVSYYSGGNTPTNTNTSGSDYNCYWKTGANSSTSIIYDATEGYMTLSDWQTTYSMDDNSQVNNPDLTDPTNGDFTLQAGSPCINAGSWLTTITSATGSGTSFAVSDAKWFHDGFGLTTGSEIQLEADSLSVTVTDINYGTNTITVNQNVYWAQGDGVAFAYSGYAPDIGAYEYEQGGPAPLQASANASPTSGQAPLTVSFTGNASGGTSPYSYSWNFGDGASSSARNPSNTYNQGGNYIVILTVTDSNSNQDTDSFTINVSAATPPLSASASASPTSGTSPLSVNFTGSASGGTSPYSYSWNFGDGGSSTAQNPSHAYSNAGTFIAILTVTDSQSNQETDSISITVNSPPALSATASGSPTSGTAPLSVNFTGSASGGTSPYSYSWNFGDGSSSTAQNPSHEYSNAGTFIAILTVTDSSSSQTTDSLTINVSSSAGTQQLSLSSITGGPAPGFGGTTNPTPGNHNYASGSIVALSAITNTDYRFSEWEGDVNASNAYNPQFSLNMDTDKDLSAFFCTRCGDVNGDLTVTASDAQGAFDIFLGRNSSPTKCETENADVSCDSNVTPGDAQAIFNKFLMRGELPADCSGNTRTQQAQSLSIQTTQLPRTHLIVDDAQVNSNGYVYVPIIIDNPSNIDAFGFDLQFPTEVMEFMTFDVTELLDEYNQVDAYYTEEGLLRVGGYSGTPLLSDSPEVLITLVFRVKDEAAGLLSLVITNTYDDIKNATVKDGTVINTIERDRDSINRSERERILDRFERLPTLLFIRF